MGVNISALATGPLLSGRSNSRGRTLHLPQLTLMIVGLMLQIASIVIGARVARFIAPGMIDNDAIHAFILTCMVMLISMSLIKQMVVDISVALTMSLWTALFIGFGATCRHGSGDLEAVSTWFLVQQLTTTTVSLALRRFSNGTPSVSSRPRTIAFLGNSQSAAMMLTQLQQDHTSRTEIIGFFDDRLNRPGPLSGAIPCLGTINDLVGYIHDAELSEVYMALPWSAGERISHLVEQLRFLPLTVRLVPDHVPPALPGRGDGQLYGVVMPTLMVPPFSAANALLKRSVDIATALLLLIPLLPLFAVVAVSLKLDSSGPIFFRQTRSGQFGRPFKIYKFRSLHVAQADTTAETLVVAGDRRVTRVGQVIRKYSIDELPQIFNVLLGQMSLVGPRPHAPRAKADGRIYAEVMPEYMMRYRVKPGMTGWAQVNGWRGNTDTEEQLRKRVEFDFQYIGKWSFGKDLEIILRTIPAMLLPPAQNV